MKDKITRVVSYGNQRAVVKLKLCKLWSCLKWNVRCVAVNVNKKQKLWYIDIIKRKQIGDKCEVTKIKQISNIVSKHLSLW